MEEHTGNTNETSEVKLASTIDQVSWSRNVAAPGGSVGLAITTNFVGNSAKLEIELSDHSGKKYGQLKENISGNRFWAEIVVPEKARNVLYADVKLSKHGLKKKSPPLLITPPIEITNLKWSAKEARRGDLLKLTADIKGVPDGTDAEVRIWEHDADGAHDFVTKFVALVEGQKVEVDWEFEYHEDTDDIPTEEEGEKGYNPPEYFFRVLIYGVSADSELLEFKDWIEFELLTFTGNESYVLRLPDGTERKGSFDKNGVMREEKTLPGRYTVEIKSDAKLP